MTEKANIENSQAKKERFEFILSINGYIVCQRYFRINNFKEYSLGSTQLTDAIEHCVSLINDDLKAKTAIYLGYTAPQVFKNKDEMKWYEENVPFKIEVPTIVVLEDSDDTFIWNGKEMEKYDKPFNKADYTVSSINTTPTVLKFAFYDNGREIRSISWDGNVYPKFVRSNIDISNSKNKFSAEGVFAPMEEFIVKQYNKSMKDLIPIIVKEICVACSEETNYNHFVTYGEKEYDIDIVGQQRAYFKKYESDYRKKTIAYFNS